MALKRPTSTFLSISTLLIFFTILRCNATPSPSPSPSPSPILTTTPSATPTADTPISLSELFELSLPEIGVQKTAVSSDSEGCKVASKQLQAIERKINEFKTVLKNRLADTKTSKPIKACLSQCQDNFEDAIDGVKTGIESISKRDLPKANIDVSAVSTDVDTCNDCFVEMASEDPEIKAFDEWVRGITGECLVNLKKG